MEYLNTKQAADYIGYSVSTLRHWRKHKDYGPKFVLTKSGRYWYSKELLDEWRSAAWSRANARMPKSDNKL